MGLRFEAVVLMWRCSGYPDADGGPHDSVQHGDRGWGEEWSGGSRQDHLRLPRGASPLSPPHLCPLFLSHPQVWHGAYVGIQGKTTLVEEPVFTDGGARYKRNPPRLPPTRPTLTGGSAAWGGAQFPQRVSLRRVQTGASGCQGALSSPACHCLPLPAHGSPCSSPPAASLPRQPSNSARVRGHQDRSLLHWVLHRREDRGFYGCS